MPLVLTVYLVDDQNQPTIRTIISNHRPSTPTTARLSIHIMSAPPPLSSLTEAQTTELLNTTRILHLLHHRNKNQHRAQPWWRHFNMFRRQTTSLLTELSPVPKTTTKSPPTSKPKPTKAAPSGSKAKPKAPKTRSLLPSEVRALTAERQERAEARLRLWTEVLVPRWWKAFSQLVAGPQYGAVGVVLLAVLGRVGRILRLVEEFPVREGEEEVLKELEKEVEEGGDVGVRVEREENVTRPFAEEVRDSGVRMEREAEEPVEEKKKGKTRKADAVVSTAKSTSLKKKREAVLAAEGLVETRMEEMEVDSRVEVKRKPKKSGIEETAEVKAGLKRSMPSLKKKAKKKKKGDAIDDIFSGLI
ncbi:hypothetical protein EJ06DRAFT_578854 [Trichodelitschia bisporula]|uniref:RNase MRP protein 1 RNA binding domain-containing protein n=1 Tax=Trichodelitschia bisporula TaxID=703511 RepID=A0A6G1I771_9PEZI|nr:hypothetical protein EJ06DRAFT_578854 [Trichodelitschia bisporula]